LVLGLVADEVDRRGWRLGFVATRVFADEELQRLREFPEISRESCSGTVLHAHPADMAFVAPQGRGPVVRLGWR
jgi:hypothetical protein